MPINVNRSALPATLASLARTVLGWLGLLAVSLGWIKAENVEGFVTIAFTLVTGGYGVWKQYRKSADLATVAHLVPDSVAKVK